MLMKNNISKTSEKINTNCKARVKCKGRKPCKTKKQKQPLLIH